jgi:hypothetical protein
MPRAAQTTGRLDGPRVDPESLRGRERAREGASAGTRWRWWCRPTARLELGGHIATYASAATLYEVGFNHFWRAPSAEFGGDLVYFQGHSAPGIYARAYLEGRLTEEQLDNFRQEVGKGQGLSSYPHPWLMPDFWQFPTVSMGSARSWRSTRRASCATWSTAASSSHQRPQGLGLPRRRRDGRARSRWARITLAGAREARQPVFVINCNLQRLDGPVRGNGKIIQELEAASAAPAGTSSRCSGAALGSAAREGQKGFLRKRWKKRRRRVPEFQGKPAAPTRASTSSASIPS